GTHVRVAFSKPAALPVPAVVGLLDSEARTRLARFKVATQDASSDARRGEVVAQAPAAGQMAAPGSVVRIDVSLADLVRVPPVAQLALAQARQALEDKGLVARIGTRAENDAAPDVVVAQQPPAGSLQPRNGEVTIDLSRGRPVPDVKQMSFEDARTTLSRFDVRPSQTSLRDPVVVTQVPEAGSWAAAGSIVKLALDARPAPPPPPPPPTKDVSPQQPADKDVSPPPPPRPDPERQSLLMVALVAVLATLATLGTAAGARAGIRKWKDAKARGTTQPPVRIQSRLDLRESTAQLDGGEAAGPLLRIETRLADARSEITIETEALHE
ncbi:MAG TPA: PASTA domain-containing protein, partial [Usitatibacter sp.]|nr:PASTA domain-containing protein [Usitatibacter sp.]